MRDHESDCEFRKIQCPEWTCEESVPLQRILDHIRLKHVVTVETKWRRASIFWTAEDDSRREEAVSLQRIFDPSYSSSSPTSITSCLGIINFAGYKFLPMCLIERGLWKTWVVMVGSKTTAEKFDVKISTDFDGQLSFKVKMYSIQEVKERINEDPEGVVEFTNSMAKKMIERDCDGNSGIRVQYVISERDPAAHLPWACDKCTLENISSRRLCEICGNKRNPRCNVVFSQ